MKRKIIIDLDVVTVGLWDSQGRNAEIAKKFLFRVERKEFFVCTPFMLVEIVLRWKNINLSGIIKEFYVRNSNKMLTDTEIREKCDSVDLNFEAVLLDLVRAGIKDEDSALILISSIFSFDLITFNRIHLKGKKEEANKILKKWKLQTIQILGPEEL